MIYKQGGHKMKKQQEEKFQTKRKEMFNYFTYLNEKYYKVFKILDFTTFSVNEQFQDSDMGSILTEDLEVEEGDMKKLDKWGEWASKNTDKLKEEFDTYKIIMEMEEKELPEFDIEYL